MEYLQETPQRQRIQRIQEKLYGIKKTIRSSENIQVSSYENLLNSISENINQHRENLSIKQDSIKNDINTLQVANERTKKLREKYFQQLTDYMQGIEQKVIYLLNEEENWSQEIEYRISKQIEDKFNSLQKDIQQEKQQRAEILERVQEKIDYETPNISETLQAEQIKRENFSQTFVYKIQQDFSQTQSQVEDHINEREQSEEAMVQMMRSIIEKFRIDLDSEKKEREETEEILLKLLEDTCSKIA